MWLLHYDSNNKNILISSYLISGYFTYLLYFTSNEVGEVDAVEVLVSAMLWRERDVVAAVPVLRQDHHVEAVGVLRAQPVHHRHHVVAVWNGEAAAAREAVLDVDHNQGPTPADGRTEPTDQRQSDRRGDHQDRK